MFPEILTRSWATLECSFPRNVRVLDGQAIALEKKNGSQSRSRFSSGISEMKNASVRAASTTAARGRS
jgi:hypothetical protein